MSFPASSLLVYRKGTDFCLLVLYPASLMKVFINSKSFLVEPLKCRIISTNKDNLPGFLFVSFSFLSCIVLAGTVWNKGGERALLVAFLILEEMLIVFSYSS